MVFAVLNQPHPEVEGLTLVRIRPQVAGDRLPLKANCPTRSTDFASPVSTSISIVPRQGLPCRETRRYTPRRSEP